MGLNIVVNNLHCTNSPTLYSPAHVSYGVGEFAYWTESGASAVDVAFDAHAMHLGLGAWTEARCNQFGSMGGLHFVIVNPIMGSAGEPGRSRNRSRSCSNNIYGDWGSRRN